MGTTTQEAAAVAVGDGAAVNGPEDERLDWSAVRWREVEQDVRRLRQRIFTASQAGDLKKVRNLQKLMLRSRANALVSVRRVAELNAGRATAGIDGEKALDSPARAALAVQLHRQAAGWQAQPVRRVFIPKANGKQRPLGIPVLMDRALQAVVVNALEPEWEARFEPRTYGFRPGRGCHDAIEAIYWTLNGPRAKRTWILDADLTAAFDRIDHNYLISALGTFPARGMVRAWLKAGVIDKGRFSPTEEGTPQGGVVSPLLLNVALHGMETAAGVRYSRTGADGARTVDGTPALVRYADDLLVMCYSREQAEQVKQRLTGWLKDRGLSFNEDKTRIVHADDGCDFLSFTIRRFNGKLLIKPSKAAVKRFRERLTAEMRALRGTNAMAVITTLNPIIRGWAAYYRSVVSKQVFSTVDQHLWQLTYRWALRSHPNKPKHWVIDRYFGEFNPARSNRWIFGDRDSGAYLRRLDWTKIVRHQMVLGTASPDDPSLTDYWAERRRKRPLPLSTPARRLLQAQHGRCPACGELLLAADHEPQTPNEWEQWIKATRKAVRMKALAVTRADDPAEQPDTDTTNRLLHAHCARQASRTRRARATQNPGTPQGLA